MAFRRACKLVFALGAIALLAPAAASATSSEQVSAALTKAAPGLGPSAGVLVKDIDTNTEIYSLRADAKLIPASNEKLFTTATALLRYGELATLPTSIRVRTGVILDPVTGVLGGDVYLVGSGDPTLSEAGLRRLVNQLQKAGVLQIAGGVRGDESFFDKRRGSFDSRWKIDGDLAGQLSALAIDHGRSGSAKQAAKRLDTMIRAAGIVVGTQPKTGRINEIGQDLATIASPTMSKLAEMINVPSENFYAEMLLKNLGGSFGSTGSTGAGASVMRDTLSSEIGIKPKVVDGSGLSRQNKTTARQLVNLLDKAEELPEISAALADSLPRIGHEGTVRKRLRGTAAASRCAAKTGTLIGVSSLSGYCESPGGRTVAFSILANRVNSGGAKQVEDSLVKAIATYSG